MNAKFEKWSDDRVWWDKNCLASARIGWEGAIQSLEVTPGIVKEVMQTEVGPWNLEDLVSDPNYLELIVDCILNKFLSALKEQAK